MAVISPNKVIQHRCTLYDFFNKWVLFLKPFHGLTGREMDVFASLLRQRYHLSESISDEDLLNKALMGNSTRDAVLKDCNMSIPHFQVIMGILRKHKVIVDGKIEPRYIPKFGDIDKGFQLLLYFNIRKEEAV